MANKGRRSNSGLRVGQLISDGRCAPLDGLLILITSFSLGDHRRILEGSSYDGSPPIQ